MKARAPALWLRDLSLPLPKYDRRRPAVDRAASQRVQVGLQPGPRAAAVGEGAPSRQDLGVAEVEEPKVGVFFFICLLELSY